MATLSPDEKILEQTRQRLYTLTSQLDKLHAQLLNPQEPLPPWPRLHAQSSILAQTLNELSFHLQNNHSYFASSAVYPLPSFPGQEQAGMLYELLGKRLTPDVAEWVEEGQKAGANVSEEAEEWQRLWKEAGPIANGFAEQYAWLQDPDDEDEDEDEGKEGEVDTEMEGVQEKDGKDEQNEVGGKPLAAEEWLRFLSKGEVPKA